MSKLGLATKCLYGFRPDVRAPERASGRAAAIGRIVHSMVEAAVTGKSFADDVDATLIGEAKAIYDGPLSHFVTSTKWTICERGYRYDTSKDTCADGPRRGEPGYEDVPPSVLIGTVDLVQIEGDSATVYDVKTGKPPLDSEQLYGQAVSISRRYPVKTVKVAYARALKTKLDLLDEETLDVDRLDAEAGRIGKRLRMLPQAEPNPGEWCWRCDAWPVCPAKRTESYVEPAAPEHAVYSDDVRLF